MPRGRTFDAFCRGLREVKLKGFVRTRMAVALSRWIAVTFLLCLFLVARAEEEQSKCSSPPKLQRKTFRSPAIFLAPGDVQDRYFPIEFPKGHVGVKNFFGEVVDASGKSVPLNQVYLHHWVVMQVYVPKGSQLQVANPALLYAGNDGICQSKVLSQYWGLGSETRGTAGYVPDPYAISIGDPSKPPAGYEEGWILNVHAIDSRGTIDPSGCLECRCALYNVTQRRDGHPLPDGYLGGLKCCYDGTKCATKEGFVGETTEVYLQYTIEWVDWDQECVVPVKSYIFDVTDDGRRDLTDPTVGCKVEYDVPKCELNTGLTGGQCVHVKETTVSIPEGGDVVFAVAHQHVGAKKIVVQGEDGREICTSSATYGSGTTPGNEQGYVVGMGSCYPTPGSIKIGSNEKLRLSSYYSSVKEHTGVMALFYILVADEKAPSSNQITAVMDEVSVVKGGGIIVLVLVLALLGGVSFHAVRRLRKRQSTYEQVPLQA